MPLVVKVQPAAKTDEEAAKEKSEQQRDATALTWAVRGVVLASVLSLLQLVAIGFQAYIARQQNRLIKGQADITANLEGASVQVKHIGMTPSSEAAFGRALHSARVQILFKNYGRSNARNVTVKSFMGLDDSPLVDKGGELPISLGSGQESGVAFDILETVFGDDEIALIENRSRKLLVFAVVTYYDVFGHQTALQIGAEWIFATDTFKWTRYDETRTASPKVA